MSEKDIFTRQMLYRSMENDQKIACRTYWTSVIRLIFVNYSPVKQNDNDWFNMRRMSNISCAKTTLNMTLENEKSNLWICSEWRMHKQRPFKNDWLLPFHSLLHNSFRTAEKKKRKKRKKTNLQNVLNSNCVDMMWILRPPN